MVKRKKQKKAIVTVELGLGGLAGLAVVCFCIFLWMFLFGVWTGQTVISTSIEEAQEKKITDVAAKFLRKKQPPINAAKEGTDGKQQSAPEPSLQSGTLATQESEGSFFAVQVSAFRDQQRAVKAVLQWRARNYESFYLLPDDPDSTFHKVFVGRFDSLADANVLASKLEASEQSKVFISLVPGGKKTYP